MQLFDTILVANRGEIAARVIRTCREMGLWTIAIYSDADVDAPHVRQADEAVRVGPAPAAESYLDVEAILDAARRTGAQAIHPGYGFLAENAAFVEAVEAAGLVFVGPRADSVRAMGDKAAARHLMVERGVPVVPGYDGEAQDDAAFIEAAEAIGYPVLVKASAGGGGKGMNVVARPEALPAALAQARRLAAAAFGDDRLLLERYVTTPRHVEVQILGDAHGAVRHVFERECSVQRRYQKIIEESPSPAVDPALRARLCAAGVAAGETLGYRGAGTVEFILDADGAFYFLEVNTRLQVEHPVTELITGLDLVAWQIRVAQGEALPPQSAFTRSGHAIEARLYAEDPARDFMPATGTVLEWAPPEGVRVDAGVVEGSAVGIHYDPLLAKVIAWGADRETARQRLVGALRRIGVQGLTTNRAFLVDALRHPAFVRGALSTHFVAEHLADWQPPSGGAVARRVAATLFDVVQRAAQAPLALRPAWRNNPWRGQQVAWQDGTTVEYVAQAGADRFEVRVGEASHQVEVHAVSGRCLVLALDGRRQRFVIVADPTDAEVRWVRGAGGAERLALVPRFPVAEATRRAGDCEAPMPGKVVQVAVAVGQAVDVGARLVVLEAMKMEQALTATTQGTVRAVHCAAGEQVDAGDVLVEIEPDEAEESSCES